MDVYRKTELPVIFTELRFIRHSASASMLRADFGEDNRQLQDVASGRLCVSCLENPFEFIVKCCLPDDILQRDRSTGDGIRLQPYYWRICDVERLITEILPVNAVSLEQAGIDACYLRGIASEKSCIPLLREVEEALHNGGRAGYRLSKEYEAELTDIERPLIAAIRLARLKRSSRAVAVRKLPSNRASAIGARLRDSILGRDNYRCIFCGQGAHDTAIEVNHIIPRSIISKLHMKEQLNTAEENLCAMCLKCNRGKSDNLTIHDVDFYIAAFQEQSHPNHGIVEHLRAIRKLQG